MADIDVGKEAVTGREALSDNLVVTQHSMKLKGKKFDYTATTGTLVLKQEGVKKDADNAYDGNKDKAEIFFTAYTKDGVKDATKRPLTFAFNGLWMMRRLANHLLGLWIMSTRF